MYDVPYVVVFLSQECFSPFVNGSFFEHEGQPLCEVHYHQSRGSVCQACQQPIVGRCVTAMGAKFHPQHLVCQFCLKPLSKGCFKEQDNKPYCHPCFLKLFGWMSQRIPERSHQEALQNQRSYSASLILILKSVTWKEQKQVQFYTVQWHKSSCVEWGGEDTPEWSRREVVYTLHDC